MIHSRVTVSSRRKGILLLFTAHAGLWTIPLRLALRIQWRRPTKPRERERERADWFSFRHNHFEHFAFSFFSQSPPAITEPRKNAARHPVQRGRRAQRLPLHSAQRRSPPVKVDREK